MDKTFTYYISVLQKQFKLFCQQELQKLGLTQGLLFFILYIGKHPNCSPKELVNALQLDSGHATRSLSKLEKQEFIQQSINLQDKRARILSLTPQGQSVFHLSHQFFTQWDQDILKNLSIEEKETLLYLLNKILRNEQEKIL